MKTREIAELVNGELVGDGDVEIDSIAAINVAGEGQIAFAERSDADLGSAACVLVSHEFGTPVSRTLIRVKEPKLAFTTIAEELHPQHQAAVLVVQ